MDLWIRSQDKSYLMPIKDIISEFGGSLFYKGIILGKYETKERALEVLDEIQKMLQPQTIINYESKLEFHPEYTVQNVVKTIPKTEIIELSTYVYEMSKE